ncbi:MAG: DUF3794 domain-containing protein [Mycobacterium leprae]
MPQAVLPLLVGEGSGQTLADVTTNFPSPVLAIEAPTKTVDITNCQVIPGKVIIVGRVTKNIAYKTAECRGTTPTANAQICCGDLRHCTVQVPFRLFIVVQGAAPGDTCQVTQACVKGEVENPTVNADGLITALQETMDIHVAVRVTRDTVMNVSAARVPLTSNLVPFPR